MDDAGKKAFELQQRERPTMKSKILSALVAMAAAFNWHAEAQIYDTNNVVVQTFAGSGFSGYLDGVGQQTMFYGPSKVVADSSSNLFVLDAGNGRIRKITPDGTVSTFAGGGTGSLPGYGTNVSLAAYLTPIYPDFLDQRSMTLDRSNALLITTVGPPELLRIRSNGYATATSLTDLAMESGVCVDSANNIYYSAPLANKIYRWRTNGVLEVFAGSGNSGSTDGNGIFTSFYEPTALAADGADNIYVFDSRNSLLRRINQNRDVSTIAGKLGASWCLDGIGTNAQFGPIAAMCMDDSGNLYLADGSDDSGRPGTCIRKMNAQAKVVTLAGSFLQKGYVNGAGNLARFNGAIGVCISAGTFYVADANNHRIRQISFNPSPEPVLPANLQLNTYPGLRIVGSVGRTYRVEASPDMTNWTARATLLLNSSPYLWIDQNPVSGTKFYRAWLLP